MNFSENQKTGALAEMDVQRLFTSWSWSTGKDFIDSGYDLFVEPDRSRFKGLRFVVQVKGTARQKKGAPRASVSKENLRKYAVNRTPVFLIRSDSEGVLYWMHVQPWTRKNLKRLTGSGETTLVLPKEQRLDRPETFHRYLDSILQPASERPGGLVEVARERAEFLSALDPRFVVRMGLQTGAETYEIFAKDEPASVQMHMTPKNKPENIDKLRDAMQYGLPATIEVDSFRVSGSELFSAIGMDSINSGTISIDSASPKRGLVRLFPGNGYSMLATGLDIPAQIYRGQKGFSVASDPSLDLLEFKMRADAGVAQTTIGLRRDRLGAVPIQEHTQLARIGVWAREVMTEKALFIEFRFLGNRVPMKSRELQEKMRDTLHAFFIIGRLHQIALALDSPLVVTDDFSLSEEDISDIHFFHEILSGKRMKINLGPVGLTTTKPIELNGGAAALITTALELSLADQPIGLIPVAINLEGYVLEATEHSFNYRLNPGPDAHAVMYYNEGGAVDAVMSPANSTSLPED
jgi:hypothetical protein